jgi:3' terminal RNA ribose 2'-O-methyltransferase Hen1
MIREDLAGGDRRARMQCENRGPAAVRESWPGRVSGPSLDLKDLEVLLTISTTQRPATDLGYLLHKNPERHHTAEVGFGTLHVVFPEASDTRCTVALLAEVDPVGLVRDQRGPAANDFSLAQYVNDRPYAASSFLSSAIAKMFGTAMSGRSKERPELAGEPIPLEARMPVVPCRGGEAILRRLFAPLGYELRVEPVPLDAGFPAWGDSRYFDVVVSGTTTVRNLLEHLYVLVPVLDDDKHYWVGPDEIDKLMRRGGAWLAGHPERELIAHRYLRHDRALEREALARLMEDDPTDPDELSEVHDAEEDAVERPLTPFPHI